MKTTGSYPRLHIDTATIPAIGQAGGILLTETIRASGLDTELSAALSRWAKPLATHDPGKIVCDLALSVALGGDCLSDLSEVRAEPGLYGPVASDPTVSRLISPARRRRRARRESHRPRPEGRPRPRVGAGR
jgi:hypothetical protein